MSIPRPEHLSIWRRYRRDPSSILYNGCGHPETEGQDRDRDNGDDEDVDKEIICWLVDTGKAMTELERIGVCRRVICVNVVDINGCR